MFGGFDWQDSAENGRRGSGGADRREAGAAGEERPPAQDPAGRPPIRTSNDAGPGSTPTSGETRTMPEGRGPGAGGPQGHAPATGANGSGTPAQGSPQGAAHPGGSRTGNASANSGASRLENASADAGASRPGAASANSGASRLGNASANSGASHPGNASPNPAMPRPGNPSAHRGAGSASSGAASAASSVPSGSDDRSAPGSQARRPGSPDREAPAPGGTMPPPPASARFPDMPPASGPGTATPAPDSAPRRPRGGTSTPGTEPRTPRPGTVGPGPLPPESGAVPAQGPGTSGVVPPRPSSRPSVPPRRPGAPAETAFETTFRMRPVPTEPASGDVRTGPTRTAPASAGRPTAPPPPAAPPTTPPPPAEPPSVAAPGAGVRAPLMPDPALSWSASMPAHGATPGSGRPVVSFGEPEVGYKERSWGVRIPPRIAAVAACAVLGLGLIGGAVTGSWLIGDSGDEGGGDTFAQAGELWHSVPVDRLFPQTVDGQGAGPGGADRTWTRIAVAPDSGCKEAFDPLLRKALAPVGCERLLRATYTDATQSYVTTVGLLFTDADATAMRDLDTRFAREGLDTRTDLMPLPYAAKNTLAAGFGAAQRASWTISVLTDAPVVAYAVSGWADGRTVDTPEPAEKAMESGDTSPAAQAGLGNEAQGLADRVERALRKTVTSPPEQPS